MEVGTFPLTRCGGIGDDSGKTSGFRLLVRHEAGEGVLYPACKSDERATRLLCACMGNTRACPSIPGVVLASLV